MAIGTEALKHMSILKPTIYLPLLRKPTYDLCRVGSDKMKITTQKSSLKSVDNLRLIVAMHTGRAAAGTAKLCISKEGLTTNEEGGNQTEQNHTKVLVSTLINSLAFITLLWLLC